MEPPEHTVRAILEAKPAARSADRELKREQLANRMFGTEPEPVRFGRFTLLNPIGEGAEGIVYDAYDPQLQRRVAVKLTQPGRQDSEAAQQRMLREATALARLSHPNVVPVHDAGVIDDQVFIVMEFVVGKTLRQWVGQDKPNWREILRVYLDAGRGLGAAHAVDVVHRDFKPDNAIVGEDGRVRVLDFGLARGTAQEDLPPSPNRPRAGPPAVSATADTLDPTTDVRLDSLTATNAVMGTPGYMAPEQFMGKRAEPPADQYAFCASLFEALYGHRPYRAENLLGLRWQVLFGELKEPTRTSIPGWVFRVLRRGLERTPSDRFASMEALVAELGRDRQRIRRRLFGVSTAGVLAIASGWSMWNVRDAQEARVCDGGEAMLAEVWNDDREATLQAAITATNHPQIDEVWERVRSGLSRYGQRWVAMYRSACELHHRGEQSDALFDKRIACLQDRRVALRSAAHVLGETTPQTLPRATDVVERLPSLRRCDDVEALEAKVPPPEDPVLATSVARVREQIIRAQALEHAGRFQDALEQAKTIEEATQTLDYPPLAASALLLLGRVLLRQENRTDAADPLRRAMLLGMSLGMNRVSLEAIARHVYAAGTLVPDNESVLRDVEFGEALAGQTPDPGFAHALLLNNAGVVWMARGNRERARDFFRQALAVKEQHNAEDGELRVILANLAMLTPDTGQRLELAREAVTQAEAHHAGSHPEVLRAKLIYSHYLTDPHQALQIRKDLCLVYSRDLDQHRRDEAPRCFYHLGYLADEVGNVDLATRSFALASQWSEPQGESAGLALTSRAQLDLYNGRFKKAREGFQRAVSSFPEDPRHWWLAEYVARAHVGLALAQVRLHSDQEALRSLTRAKSRCDSAVAMNYHFDLRRVCMQVNRLMGPLLWNGADPDRTPDQGRAHGIEMMRQARQWYTRNGPGYDAALQEIDRWLAGTNDQSL